MSENEGIDRAVSLSESDTLVYVVVAQMNQRPP